MPTDVNPLLTELLKQIYLQDDVSTRSPISPFFGVDRSVLRRGLRWDFSANEVHPKDTWPEFLTNWAQIGLAHQRRVYCQPLLDG